MCLLINTKLLTACTYTSTNFVLFSIVFYSYKLNKYSSLKIDLENSGFNTFLFCCEVSVRGQINKTNKSALKTLLFKSTDHGRSSFKSFINSISKAGLLGYFTIFNARNEISWNVHSNISVKI